jgi:hypothetical protein
MVLSSTIRSMNHVERFATYSLSLWTGGTVMCLASEDTGTPKQGFATPRLGITGASPG